MASVICPVLALREDSNHCTVLKDINKKKKPMPRALVFRSPFVSTISQRLDHTTSDDHSFSLGSCSNSTPAEWTGNISVSIFCFLCKNNNKIVFFFFFNKKK